MQETLPAMFEAIFSSKCRPGLSENKYLGSYDPSLANAPVRIFNILFLTKHRYSMYSKLSEKVYMCAEENSF